jgi:ferredoxin
MSKKLFCLTGTNYLEHFYLEGCEMAAKRKRYIIKIDENLCNGCGKCASACVEGAIEIVDGKARLVSETYCDGLGACIGECPQGAITLVEREAEEFDPEAALRHAQRAAQRSSDSLVSNASETGDNHHTHPDGSVCPSARTIDRREELFKNARRKGSTETVQSELANWPVKLRLVNPSASFFQGANLLVAADCTAFAYGAFHPKLLTGKVVVTGCPKFDDVTLYVHKLIAILQQHDIKSLTVAKMEVPCCSGLVNVARQAVEASGKNIPIEIVTISLCGELIERKFLDVAQSDEKQVSIVV